MNKPIDISNIILKTERLVLRPWKESDADDMYEYASVDGVGQMAGWLPHRSREESSAIIEMFMREKKTFAIEKDGKVIGSVGIEEYNEKELPDLDALYGREIGYVLSKEYWGQGLTPEAVKRVIQYLFDEEKLNFIVCAHFLWNDQSRRVQEKCGFVRHKMIKYETQFGTVEDGWLTLIRR